MKDIKLNLSEGKDIIMRVPDGVEITTSEAITIMILEAQEQVVNGNMKITKRIWSCFYCGKDYSKQQKLLKHLEIHEERKESIKNKLQHLYRPSTEDSRP